MVPPLHMEVVNRIRAGDHAAFEHLFRTHFAAMFRFAMSFVADRDVAEDLVQEVLGRVWMQRATWTPSTDVLSYLLAAVRNRALNVVTTEHRRTTMVERYRESDTMPGLGQAIPMDQRLDVEQRHAMLWGVIHTLPEHQRTTMLLRWRYGLDWTEIATIMGTTAVAARKNHSRALEALRHRLPGGLE